MVEENILREILQEYERVIVNTPTEKPESVLDLMYKIEKGEL